MGKFSFPASLGVLLSLACAPSVITHSNPPGLNISGQTIKYGAPETTLVSLSIKRQAGAPSWTAAFTDGTNTEIIAEDIPGLTILKWKVDRERMKTLTSKPFNLNIKSGDLAYSLTVSFNSAGRDMTGQIVTQVFAHVLAGR
jgi:hypothetical protein